MRIGIDISQTQYRGTGVAAYVTNLVENLIKIDDKNTYILFLSTLRGKFEIFNLKFENKSKFLNLKTNKIILKRFYFPSTLLDILWNRLHIMPIEWLIGDVNVFISSDWTQPPTLKAKKATFVYDLTPLKYPEEMGVKITEVHKRRLEWVKRECDVVFCDSESAKRDIVNMLSIPEDKVKVIYPGI